MECISIAQLFFLSRPPPPPPPSPLSNLFQYCFSVFFRFFFNPPLCLPFSVTHITSPGKMEWTAIIFSSLFSPSLNVMHLMLGIGGDTTFWTNREIQRESYWGRMKERRSEFTMVQKTREVRPDKGGRTTAACVFCLKPMPVESSTISICCCCYVKDGLWDDAIHSRTNWICWGEHARLLTGGGGRLSDLWTRVVLSSPGTSSTLNTS